MNILVLDNFITGKPDDLAEITDYKHCSYDACTSSDGVVLIQGDVRDMKIVKKCTEGVDCIIHLAANTGVGPSVA